MRQFDEKTYQELISGASKKLYNKDLTYKDDFNNAFEYLRQFVREEVMLPLVKELETEIPKLGSSEIHSKQNLELFKNLTLTLELIKPI